MRNEPACNATQRACGAADEHEGAPAPAGLGKLCQDSIELFVLLGVCGPKVRDSGL